jgi:hypothetical protein
MTTLQDTTRNNKVSHQIDIVKEIQILHDEVHSLQRSVNLVLRRLPYVVHDELSAHERERRYYDYRILKNHSRMKRIKKSNSSTSGS